MKALFKSFIKNKKERFYPLWIRKDYVKYTSEFEKIRCLMLYKADHCFKCGKGFKGNEIIALVGLKNVGNKVFCQKCCKKLIYNL